MTSPRQLGCWAVLALVALRLGIGWHFFKEGAKKFEGDSFTSSYFLQTAKGPMAGFYKSMLPDRFGLERLDEGRTAKFWQSYLQRAEAKYGFNAEQSKEAKQLVNLYRARLKKYLAANVDEVSEYKLEVERYKKSMTDPTAVVPFQSNRNDAKEVELRGKATPWINGVTTFGEQLQQAIYGLCTDAPT